MDAYQKALKLLKIRPHHSAELTKKLLMRGFDRPEIDEVVKKLQEENLIDNDQFAQAFLEELIRNKILGFYGLKAKLMQRGIASNEAEKLLKENFSFEDEKNTALQLADKESDKMKLAQKLQRNGFRSEVISEIISHLPGA